MQASSLKPQLVVSQGSILRLTVNTAALVNVQHKGLSVTVSEMCQNAPNLLEALVKLLGEEEHLTCGEGGGWRVGGQWGREE